MKYIHLFFEDFAVVHHFVLYNYYYLNFEKYFHYYYYHCGYYHFLMEYQKNPINKYKQY